MEQIYAAELEPELSEAGRKLTDAKVKENLDGYTPKLSDWPWRSVEKKRPDPLPEEYTPVFYDFSGSAGALSVDTDAREVSFTFTVHISERGGGGGGEDGGGGEKS